MGKSARWLYYVGASLVGSVLLLWAIGATLSGTIDITTETTVRQPPAQVWGAVTDPGAIAKWHPHFAKAEALSPTRWRRCFKDGFVATYEVTALEPGVRVEAEQVERDQPFWGRYAFELRPVDEATVVRVVSHAEIRPPWMRLMVLVVGSPGSEIQRIASGLKRYVESLPAQ
jgi:uncharacterized protein YndB with AHSA1/START domain